MPEQPAFAARVSEGNGAPVAQTMSEESERRQATSAVGESLLAAKVAVAPAPGTTVQGAKTSGSALSLEQPATSQPEIYDRYDEVVESSFLPVVHNPLSTFSIDVDTASYSNLRRFLVEGQSPPAGVVRIEEMLNYFSYSYPEPFDRRPLSVHTELTLCPWNEEHQLLRVGIQAKRAHRNAQPPLNLAFLIDVSGSMESSDKLPLLVEGLRLLAGQLRPIDRVAIVTYAGSSGLALPSTSGDHQSTILAALDALRAGGSTNGASGINLAYTTVRQNFAEGAVNRVILATDGDFNVGLSSDADLTQLIGAQRKSGIYLTVLGFGRGNLNDSMMEKLADRGNGSYAYIDSIREAKKVLVEEVAGTLVPVAKDVKIQVELNQEATLTYRLLGYENRALASGDFTDDGKDAGELGAGQSVTALYELVPRRAQRDVSLRYQRGVIPTKAAGTELATVRIRYKLPTALESEPLEHVVHRNALSTHPSADQLTAAGIAAFGMVLRSSRDRGRASLELAGSLVDSGRGSDPDGRRAELAQLILRSRGLERKALAQ